MILNNDNITAVFTNKTDGNIAYHVTDDFNSVDKSRNELSNKYRFDIENLKYMDQIHSDLVYIVNEENIYRCDALVTDRIDIPLMVMVADCIPILFYDPVKSVIAAAHAGRNGTFTGISGKVIKVMKEQFNCKAGNIELLMGPSIGKCCYEVSQELASVASNSFGKEFVQGRFLDLQSINKKQLMDEGVLEKNINISAICTKCSGEDYFSYREDKNCGRFAGIIMMRSCTK